MSEYMRALLDGFDPNTQKQPWATFVPNRSPSFKAHSKRAVALQTISYYEHAILYEWDNDVSRWAERARKCPEDHRGRCQNCQGSTLETGALLPHNDFDTGVFVWEKENGKIGLTPSLIFVCKRCYGLYR